MVRQLAFTLSLLMLSSCATVFAKNTRSIMVTSNPPGAEITVNGVAKGLTPTRISVNDHQRLQVAIRKPGFHGGGCYVNTSIGAVWVIADLIFIAAVLPLVIDLITNSWSSLDTSYCTVNLMPLRQ